MRLVQAPGQVRQRQQVVTPAPGADRVRGVDRVAADEHRPLADLPAQTVLGHDPDHRAGGHRPSRERPGAAAEGGGPDAAAGGAGAGEGNGRRIRLHRVPTAPQVGGQQPARRRGADQPAAGADEPTGMPVRSSTVRRPSSRPTGAASGGQQPAQLSQQDDGSDPDQQPAAPGPLRGAEHRGGAGAPPPPTAPDRRGRRGTGAPAMPAPRPPGPAVRPPDGSVTTSPASGHRTRPRRGRIRTADMSRRPAAPVAQVPPAVVSVGPGHGRGPSDDATDAPARSTGSGPGG